MAFWNFCTYTQEMPPDNYNHYVTAIIIYQIEQKWLMSNIIMLQKPVIVLVVKY